MSKVIGLDIGHSAVKIATRDKTILFPSAVRQAIKITDETEAKRCAAETVRVGSTSYFIGETALIQGAESMGLFDDWIETPEHTALMIGGMNKAVDSGASKDAMVVMGLPANLFGRQRARLKEIAQSNLNTEVMVVSQPFGPFNKHMLDAKGMVRSSQALTSESWGVIEIGFFSTDFALIQKNRWTESASGGCSGVRVAAESLQRLIVQRGVSADLVECDDALRTKSIRNYQEKMDVTNQVNEAIDGLASTVIDTSTRLLETYARKLDGIIVAGGGAGLLGERLAKKWGNVIQIENPRFSVAEGMRRFGEMQLIIRALSNG